MRGVSKLVVLGLPMTLLVVGCEEESDSVADAGTEDGSMQSDASTQSDASMQGDGSPASDASDASGDAPVADLDVEVVFEARVGDEAFACDGSYTGLGATDSAATPLDFRLYVHDVRMIAADGVEHEVALDTSDFVHEGVTLLDFEDNTGTCTNGNAAMNDRVIGTVPGGQYDGLAFTVGVPVELNHADPAAAASPLDLTSLHWNWAGGYKFMRIDFTVSTAADGAGAPFNFHLGSTMCAGDPAMGDTVTCDNPNRPRVVLDGFDPATQKIVIDYAALVVEEDLDTDLGGAPGCMSGGEDGDCPKVFAALGLDLATGEASGSQQVFKVEER